MFNIGDGQDTIVDFDYNSTGGVDKIIFGEGITVNDLKVTKSTSNQDLLISFENGDSIRIDSFYRYFFSNGNYKIEEFHFADGTVLHYADFDVLTLIDGTDANDSITGSNSNDIIYAGNGDDTINASGGNDIISGGSGNDIISDHSGFDTYLFFNLGDGMDTIKDQKLFANEVDKVVFGEGLSANDFTITKDNTTGCIKLQFSSGDAVNIAGIEELHFF